ncbi:MAG: DNA repair protein RecO [Cellvibrionaceae bacterium]
MQVQLQPAYVLHTRAYRDTSLLVDILTRDHGRLTVVARGQRQARQKARKPLQPFTMLLLSWQGRSDLKTLTTAETDHVEAPLFGDYLYSGLYANELLMRLLPDGDAQADIFLAYQHLIQRFARKEPLEATLRQFEFQLLEELGYGLDLASEANTGEPIGADKLYHYLSDLGFLEIDKASHQAAAGFFGEELLAIARVDYSQKETRRAAKRLARLALTPHLGNKPLKSRELFR